MPTFISECWHFVTAAFGDTRAQVQIFAADFGSHRYDQSNRKTLFQTLVEIQRGHTADEGEQNKHHVVPVWR